MALSILGRPGYFRLLEPSNFFATNFRCQASMVSGLTTFATSSSAFRPSFLPSAAKVLRSPSVSFNRLPIWPRRIRFSARWLDLEDGAQIGCAASPGRAVEAPVQSLDERRPGIRPVGSVEGVEGGDQLLEPALGDFREPPETLFLNLPAD